MEVGGLSGGGAGGATAIGARAVAARAGAATVGTCCAISFTLGRIVLVSAFEVSFVPAATFEAEGAGGDEFLQLRCSALRAVAQFRITHLLQRF